MKFKHIIGLDIGTNSLGWCLIKEYEDESIEIVKTGVHIFPIGTIVDDVSNKEKTRNEQRREYRGASRMRYRFKLRRKNLKDALTELGMLSDFSKYHKAKGKGQSYELYKLRADAINPKNKIPLEEIGRIFMLLNKYRGFKSNAKKLAQKDKEAGVVNAGTDQLEKFIATSNSKTIGEYFFKMHEKARQWYEENKWHNPNEPIDERAYSAENGEFILFNSNGIRRHHGRYTLRKMYTDEFDLIWETQQKHHPQLSGYMPEKKHDSSFKGNKQEYDEIMKLPYRECIDALKKFKDTKYWHIKEYCIYYQRPLKSQKKYVSNCQFERGEFESERYTAVEHGVEKTKEKRIWKKKAKKACPKSHPLFQEFRIWQKLHQINFSSTELDEFQKPLKPEWLPVLADALMENFKVCLNGTPKVKKDGKPYFGNILQEKGLIQNADEYTFYIDKTDEDVADDDKNENRIHGNVTYSAFMEALGAETFSKIKNGEFKMTSRKEKSTLWDLWHHLYIAKDGLFKEDDWLKKILTEPTKWNFTEAQADKLIEKGLVGDYASYSSKVLKAILPHMRQGLNEYEALKRAGYVNDDNTVGEKIKLRDKISQLRYQELRNPVVERALSKSIRLVNALLERYQDEIDRSTLEIRIESTRQLRKPRQERENERRKNSDKDKLRQQYAEYLTANKAKLGFAKDIFKNDSIVGKYELWLQMNMNEDDETFIKEFKAFSKITKEQDRLKHKLWLECGRRCPYTGEIINFTDCFSSEVEIEHIIPLSRGLDDSFNNKTLTYRKTNALKGSMTPVEFMQKLGGGALKNFKSRLKNANHDFSDSKKKLFLAENIAVDFSNSQISNTSYIARYTVKKMREVCRNVQFTNGSATAELRNNDWSLSNLLDKIRYEEDFNINMDEIYSNYYRIKKDFRTWYEKKHKTTDYKWKDLLQSKDLKEYIKATNNDLLYWAGEIEKFNEFRNKSGKKDRSDHRHHAVDAFVIAGCSPKIIQTLSTYNSTKESNGLEYRDRIERSFDYDQLKQSIANILVSHSEKQTLIKKRKNRVKTKTGIKLSETYAPQGKLHEESFYSKRNGATVRRVELFDDQRQDKALFSDADKLHYKVKGEIKWHLIPDDELYKITKRRLDELGKNAFTKESMEKIPFYRVSPKSPDKITSGKKGKEGKPVPIVKSVRKRFNIDRTLINLPAKDREGRILTMNRYADNDSNHVIAFYKNGRKSFAKPISFYESVKNKRDKKALIPDEVEYKDVKYGIDNQLPWLKAGDIVFICLKDDTIQNIDWKNFSLLKDRLFKVKGFSTSITPNPKYGGYEYGNTSLLNIRIAKTDSYPSQKKIEDALTTNSFTLSHDKFNAIKVRLNILGEIIAKGQECFEPIQVASKELKP